MLQSGGAWSGVRAAEMLTYVASLHAQPAPGRRCSSSGSGSAVVRPDAVPPAQRRPAAAARPGDGDRRPAGARLPRRADRRARPAGAARHLGARRAAAPRRRHGRAHHALHGGGRAARDPASYVVDRGRVVASRVADRAHGGGARSNTIRFRAKPGLDTDELLMALPDEYCSVDREPAGRLPGRRRGHPPYAGHRHRLVRRPRRDARGPRDRAAHPRGRLPRAHRHGPAP